jgi:hypothetical protein
VGVPMVMNDLFASEAITFIAVVILVSLQLESN